MIRAAAAQAAATLMAPSQPLPANYVGVAQVVEAYIRYGKDAAFALCPSDVEDEAASHPERVMESVPEMVASAENTRPAPPVELVTDSEPIAPDADVIPLVARGQVSGKQEDARRIVEKHKRERVDSIVAQASVAKAKAHRQRLIDQAEESQLSGYPIIIEGKSITLGAYLASL